MINFTVGPVQSSQAVCQVGAEQVPYFRTEEFSAVMKENEQLIKKMSYAEDDARALFITGSGTASMEATVMNVFSDNDKVLVVNGGSFGERFVQICKIHGIPHTEIKLVPGETLTEADLNKFSEQKYTGFLINMHETSTGVLYDMEMVSNFCKRNGLFLVVDAISAFIADPFKMAEWGVDVMITGSQKALACPPGISVIVLSPKAVERVEQANVKSLYFDLALALKNGERGQTPFTPAVGILRQINTRLKEIDKIGIEGEQNKIKTLAEDFRSKIEGLPVEITSNSLSNAVTPLHPLNTSAYRIFSILKDEYGIWVCPNGGELAEKIFRVGHIGELTSNDNDVLIQALKDLYEKGLL